jgi:hypothetical protein
MSQDRTKSAPHTVTEQKAISRGQPWKSAESRVPALEPESISLDEADVGNRAVADLAGYLSNFIKEDLRRRIHDPV